MPEQYEIDWDKVATLDDMKRVIAVLDIRIDSNAPCLPSIKDLVKPTEPIKFSLEETPQTGDN